MPEGPEIRIAADQLETVLVDKTVEAVFFSSPTLKRFEPVLTGALVQAV